MNKIIEFRNLDKLIKKLKKENKSIVLCGGCFDILHLGHLRFLKAAKNQGDTLIVALEGDKTIKKIKGKKRPVNQQKIRAKNLAAFSVVEYIILLPEMKTDRDYQNLLFKIKPQIIAVTENDPIMPKKREQAKVAGAKVIPVIPYLKGYSTTKITKILKTLC